MEGGGCNKYSARGIAAHSPNEVANVFLANLVLIVSLGLYVDLVKSKGVLIDHAVNALDQDRPKWMGHDGPKCLLDQYGQYFRPCLAFVVLADYRITR